MSDSIDCTLRRTYQCIRQRIPKSYQQQCAQRVLQRIEGLLCFQEAKHIAFYSAIRGELDVHDIWQLALQYHKMCYFPVILQGSGLSFLPAHNTSSWQNNRFGIAEPRPSFAATRAANELDLVLLPLVAFDRTGTRLGMGGGYYDRTFQDISHPFLLGVAYEFQQQNHLKRQAWDVPLDAIITEHRVYWSASHDAILVD
jgi:5-formyltetrahydrofolate cyclo-ligase